MDSIDLIKNNFKVAFITNANYPINQKSVDWGWHLHPTKQNDKIDFKKYNVKSMIASLFFISFISNKIMEKID